MTRVYVDAPLQQGACLQLDDDAAQHLVQVLRMRTGDAFTVFNGQGGEYDAVIESAARKELVVRIGAFHDVDRESALKVTLAQCISKGERMDYTVQKAAELGVAAIVPLISANCVVRLDPERWEKKLEHWRGVMVSACEQCGRTRLPVLHAPVAIDRWLPQADGIKLVLAIGATRALRSLPQPSAPVCLLAGPEGDFSDAELGMATSHGFARIGLGPRILRTETAGVAALAALQALFGDLT